MSTDTIKYMPTMDLRFVRRVLSYVGHYDPRATVFSDTVRILQQRFSGSDGSERWVDVPEGQEFNTTSWGPDATTGKIG